MDNPTDTGALLPVTPFEREERYIVFKKSHLTQKQIDTLDKLRTPPGIPPVNWHDDHTMPTVECVVVEADWPEYEPVWSMIKARVNGRHQSETGAALTRDGREALEAAPFYLKLVEKALQDYVDGSSDRTLSETARDIIASISNPCAKIFDHKWLDPECVETGCQSLVWKSRYEAAVKGRQEFRQALRDERAAALAQPVEAGEACNCPAAAKGSHHYMCANYVPRDDGCHAKRTAGEDGA